MSQIITDLWSKTIDAQVELARSAARSRQLGIGIVGASLIVAAVLAGGGSHVTLAIGSSQLAIHVSALVLGAAAVMLVLLRILDLDVHERMQRGAASLADALEKKAPEQLEGLSKKLSFVSDESARRTYAYATAVPAIAAALVLLAGNVRGADQPPANADAVAEEELPAAPATTLANTTPEVTPATTVAPAPIATPAPTATAPVPAPTAAAVKPVGKNAKAAPVAATAKPVEATPPTSVTPPPAAKAEPAPAKADPPSAKVEEPKPAEPPAAKAEEPKPADPTP